jgi:anti-sigma-K factor RskA
MKSCLKNRKDIALLAVDALETRRERELRAHLAACAGCRRYLEEISRVAGSLRAAEPEPGGQPSASFQRDVAGALAAAERCSAGGILLAKMGFLWNWRLAWPAVAALALVIAALLTAERRATKPAPAVASAIATPADLAPTFSNYEMAAHQSLDKLDELLTEQGNRSPAPPATYTGSLSRLNAAE